MCCTGYPKMFLLLCDIPLIFSPRFFPGCLVRNLFLFAANEFHGSPSRGDGSGDRQSLQVLRGVQERQGNLPPLRPRQGLYSQPDLLDLKFFCHRQWCTHALHVYTCSFICPGLK